MEQSIIDYLKERIGNNNDAKYWVRKIEKHLKRLKPKSIDPSANPTEEKDRLFKIIKALKELIKLDPTLVEELNPYIHLYPQLKTEEDIQLFMEAIRSWRK